MSETELPHEGDLPPEAGIEPPVADDSPGLAGGDAEAEERIRERAYAISQGDDAGSDLENWLRAERELHGGGGTASDETVYRGDDVAGGSPV